MLSTWWYNAMAMNKVGKSTIIVLPWLFFTWCGHPRRRKHSHCKPLLNTMLWWNENKQKKPCFLLLLYLNMAQGEDADPPFSTLTHEVKLTLKSQFWRGTIWSSREMQGRKTNLQCSALSFAKKATSQPPNSISVNPLGYVNSPPPHPPPPSSILAYIWNVCSCFSQNRKRGEP